MMQVHSNCKGLREQQKQQSVDGASHCKWSAATTAGGSEKSQNASEPNKTQQNRKLIVPLQQIPFQLLLAVLKEAIPKKNKSM